jgi:alpha-1,2-mannosyltransferase
MRTGAQLTTMTAGRLPAGLRLRRIVNSWTLAWCSFLGALGFSIYIAVATWQVDLLVYLMGGRYASSSMLYTVSLSNTHPPLFFTYTPLAAILFGPIGWLGTSPSSAVVVQAVWTSLNICALVALINVTIGAVRPEVPKLTRWRYSMLLTVPALFLNPVLLTMTYGQVNLMLALLVLWDLLGTRRIGSRTLPQGLATGLAVAIKLTPAIFIPFMFLTGRRRGARNTTLTFLGCVAFGFALSPRASWVYWTKDVFKPSRTGGLLYLSDQNLSSAIQRFDHGTLGGGVLVPVVLAIGIVGVVLAVWAHRRSSPALGVIVCATTGLIVSPVTWAHHLVWVVPAVIWLAVARDRPRYGVRIAVGVAVLFWACPIWWAPRTVVHELTLHGWQLVAGNSFLLAMLAFLVGVIVLLMSREYAERRDARRPPAPAVALEESAPGATATAGGSVVASVGDPAGGSAGRGMARTPSVP